MASIPSTVYLTHAIRANLDGAPERLIRLANELVHHAPYFGAKPTHNRYFVGGWAYLALGRIDEAFDLLAPVIRMQDTIPVPLSALQILVCAYLARKDAKSAASTLSRIVRLYGVNPDTRFLCQQADKLYENELAQIRSQLVLPGTPPAQA